MFRPWLNDYDVLPGPSNARTTDETSADESNSDATISIVLTCILSLNVRLKCCQRRRNISNFMCILSRITSFQSVSPVRYITLANEHTVPVNIYTNRTHTCGELRESDIGKKVKLCGWVEFRRMDKFLILRDGYGSTQLMISDELINAKCMENLTYESVISVSGTVSRRPAGQENMKMMTGCIEVSVEQMTVLNYAKSNLPFSIREYNKAKESIQLKYRYLSLRYSDLQKTLRTRSEILMKMREFLSNCRGFVEVETPTLFCRTPGGAQEFVVPTRKAGHFYSLVQSPQQFKQLLMVGGIDRYYQIARCYRDEGARPDRQPEFTQLDIEMSFSNRDGVLALVEELLNYSWPTTLDKINIPFPRMTYETAMDEYGTDKPDTRFENKLKNIENILNSNESSLLKEILHCEDITSRAIVFPGEAAHFTTSIREKYEDISKKEFSHCILFVCKIAADSSWKKKLQKFFSSHVIEDLQAFLNLQSNDVLFLSVGSKDSVQGLLGKLRVSFMDVLKSKGIKIINGCNFLWVVDFPLFVAVDDIGTLESAHHPFTQPHPEDIHLLSEEPLKVRSLHYDLVFNGSEVGGGSIRIHDPDLQLTLLRDFLKLDPEPLQHLLDALHSGCPPHGGIALGIDRLLCEMFGTSSIRDVIAFPKTFEGRDLMSGAPVLISENDKKLYHIKVIDDN